MVSSIFSFPLQQNNAIQPAKQAGFVEQHFAGAARQHIAKTAGDVGAEQGAENVYETAKRREFFVVRLEFIKDDQPLESIHVPALGANL